MDSSKNGGPRAKVRADDRRGSGPGERGQVPFEVRDGERELVKEWGRALTARQIGLILRGPTEPISKDTILRHFAEEFAWARAHLISELAGSQIDAAKGGDAQAGRWLLEKLGESGQFGKAIELTGRGGGPILHADIADLQDLSDEELTALERVASIFAGRLGEGDAGTAETVSDPSGPDTAGT